MKEYVTYSQECGFNIIEASDIQEAAIMVEPDFVVLDEVDEFDEVILERIRELLN